MKIKTSELTGAALDWAVAKAEGLRVAYIDDGITQCLLQIDGGRYAPSTDWSQGGPFIEREKISVALGENETEWEAVTEAALGSMFGTRLCGEHWHHGPTPLIAAMRCFVASKLGDEIELPEELK
jgi:hypothetical protein